MYAYHKYSCIYVADTELMWYCYVYYGIYVYLLVDFVVSHTNVICDVYVHKWWWVFIWHIKRISIDTCSIGDAIDLQHRGNNRKRAEAKKHLLYRCMSKWNQGVKNEAWGKIIWRATMDCSMNSHRTCNWHITNNIMLNRRPGLYTYLIIVNIKFFQWHHDSFNSYDSVNDELKCIEIQILNAHLNAFYQPTSML